MLKKYQVNKPDLGKFEYESDMSFEEIAQIMNVSSSYVIELYNKGMAKLIKRYRDGL